MLRFKVDENMPVEVAELLTAADHDALTAVDQQLGGHPDQEHARVCKSETRALRTFDLDFADIQAYPPADYPGILVFRLSRLDKARTLSVVKRLLPMIDQEPLLGMFWIVDESSVRIRS